MIARLPMLFVGPVAAGSNGTAPSSGQRDGGPVVVVRADQGKEAP